MTNEITVCTTCGCDPCSCSSGCGSCGSSSCSNSCCDNSIHDMVPVVHVAAPQPAGAEATQNPTLPDCCCTQSHDCLRADFVMPVVDGVVNLEICDESNYYAGQELFIRGAGYLTIVSFPSDTEMQVTNDGRPGNAAPGTVIVAELGEGECTPIQGFPPLPPDVILPNVNDKVCADFQIPSVGNCAEVCISNVQEWACPGQYIYLRDAATNFGYFQINAIVDENHAEICVEELGTPGSGVTWTGNASPGTTVPEGSCVISTAPPPPELDSTTAPTDTPSFLLGSSGGSNVDTAVAFQMGGTTTKPPLGGGSAPTPLPLTLAHHDNRAGANLSGNGYVLPEDGEWSLKAFAEISETANNGDYLLIFGINDAFAIPSMPTNVCSIPTGISGDCFVGVQTQVRLNAGDEVKVYVVYSDATGVLQQLNVPIENVLFSGHQVNP